MHLLPSTIRLAAAALVVAAAGLALPAAPASAATCTGSSGVSVVVDFHELGGGVQTACVAGGAGQSAASLFDAAGFPLTWVQRQPGFVCQVAGLPASSPCVSTPPTDAYWGLWWSDGSSGQWTYATRGASSQSVPDGGYVAFSWNGSTTRAAPGVAPAAHPTQAATPTATTSQSPTTSQKPTSTKPPKATSKPVHTPAPSYSTKPSAGSAAPTRSTPPSATPTSQTTRSPTPKSPATTSPAPTSPNAETATESSVPPSAGTAPATPDPSDQTAPASSDPATPSDGGLPTWVGPAVVAVLFAAGAAVAVVRRRGKSS